MPRTLLNPLMYGNQWKDLFLDTAGSTVIKIPKGYFQLIIRGAGGCGGQKGGDYSYAGGAGGAGGPGLLTQVLFLNTIGNTQTTLYVGEQGKTRANGGNGGQGGQLVGTGGVGGDGGGAGEPSYAFVGSSVYYADSGAGGGGGGGSNDAGGRNSDGGCGGGGGGRKYFDTNTNTIVAVDGKKGANNTQNAGGVGGLTGDNITFPQVYSGAGGASNWSGGGRSTGGGASGSSGSGRGNHSGGEGGSGGGGAAGDNIAGGGARGGASSHFGENAYNHYTTGIDTTAENAEYGIIGNYGSGGDGNSGEGASGCIVLRKIGRYILPEVFDMGAIDAIPDETIDCGAIDSTVTDMIECGTIM